MGLVVTIFHYALDFFTLRRDTELASRAAGGERAGLECAAMPADSRSPLDGGTTVGGSRWHVRGGLVALAMLAASVIVLIASSGHAATESDQLLGMVGSRRAPTYMLQAVGQQGDQAREYYAPPSQRQPAMDFPMPEQTAMQQLSSAEELANPASAPNYNGAEGMTYMPSTQSGVSDEDQSPTLSKEFLDDEDKSKRRMKKLAKLLRKSAKKQDLLDVEVSYD